MAVKAFERFLQAENVDLLYVKTCIARNTTGHSFVSVMDKFGMYLAFNEGKGGNPLARNTASQYYRQAKLWLLELFPQHRAALEARLFKMGRTLESHCMKREGGGFVKKANACTKNDLKQLMYYLYSNACSYSDYQDAALLCLLWHLFGRASDLVLVRKQNTSVDAGDVFFLRFVRVNTSEQQGPSLFPDTDFLTCPLHAIALALMTQQAPCGDLLDNLPIQQARAADSFGPDTPLVDLLDNPNAFDGLQASVSTGFGSSSTILSHVNRILDRVAKPAGVVEQLTSHSFRRGGAQHANGSAQLTARWIFDRGAWNMSTTNKGFNYVFNTTAEDHKVAKILSDWSATDPVAILDLSPFDTQTHNEITEVQRLLFTTCQRLESTRYNVNQRVLDVLTAYLIARYPLLKGVNPVGPAITRLEAYVLQAGYSVADLLSWSSHLASAQAASRRATYAGEKQQPSNNNPSDETEERRLESKPDRARQVQDTAFSDEASKEVSQPSKRRKKTSVTYLKTAWFAWYAQEPRLWSSHGDKQKKSDAKHLVAFMKLFLEADFSLDAQSPAYRDQVMALGTSAEGSVLEFLHERGIASKGENAVLKEMRVLHRAGALNDRIQRYRSLLWSGAIVDPAPGSTQGILEVM